MTDSSRVFILFLTANPSGTPEIDAQAEVSAILKSTDGPRLRVEQRWGVDADDFRENMRKWAPVIVHWSGHGVRSRAGRGTKAREVEPEEREVGTLVAEDEHGDVRMIPTQPLAELFALAVRSVPIRCVVLNACFTEAQAKAIAEHVDFVVGTTRAIKDRVAIKFSEVFYQTIVDGESLLTAFEYAKNAIDLMDEDSSLLKWWSPPTVDPARIFLRERDRAPEPTGGIKPAGTDSKTSPVSYLQCDRAVLVDHIRGFVMDSRPRTIMLCGRKEDGCNRFTERIKKHSLEFEAAVIDVHPDIFEVGLDALREGLEVFLHRQRTVSLSEIPEVLASCTTANDKALLLSYPPVDLEDLDDDERARRFAEHHAVTLPNLFDEIEKARASGSGRAVVVIQPVRWKLKPRWWDRFTGSPKLEEKQSEVERFLRDKVGPDHFEKDLIGFEHLGEITVSDAEAILKRIYGRQQAKVVRALELVHENIKPGASAETIFTELHKIVVQLEHPPSGKDDN